MAPPTKVPPRTVFKEIYILPYKFAQIHVGNITEVEVFFAAYNSTAAGNFVCPYAFFEKLPDAAERKVQAVLTGIEKETHSVTTIGMRGPVLKYDPLGAIALNELTGSTTGKVTTGNVAIAAQRGNIFLVRINIDNDPGRDGRVLRAFMLEFEGTAPKDLIGKTFIGSFGALSLPVVDTGTKAWDSAEKRLQAMYTPFESIAQP